MTKLFKCDRCKNVVEKVITIKHPYIFLGVVNPLLNYVKKDLCENCYSQFNNWLNNSLYMLPKRIYNPKDRTIKEVKQ